MKFNFYLLKKSTMLNISIIIILKVRYIKELFKLALTVI